MLGVVYIDKDDLQPKVVPCLTYDEATSMKIRLENEGHTDVEIESDTEEE
ncbi:hypothetical protein ACLHWY_23465 [Priestia aryabhattai]